MTAEEVRGWKEDRPILALTAYDYPLARMLDESGADILHVGDTLGMVVLGYPDTTHVTMGEMLHHTRAVARARVRALVTADLPIHAYDTVGDAVKNARALVDAGADAVKMEGGEEILRQVEAVVASGVPVQGHIGLLPQKIKEEGAYRKKGRTEAEVSMLGRDAKLLEEVGVFSVVIEAVVAEVAAEITQLLRVPTIGIASGFGTTGQIRVTHDLLGMYPWFAPPFVKPFVRMQEIVEGAVESFRREVSQERSRSC